MIIIRSRTLIYNCRYLLHHSAFNGQFFQWESRKCLAATSRGSPAKQARGCISVAKVPESLAALRQMHPPQSPAAPALPYGKATHYNLRVASLLQIVFAGATRVRCHPGGGVEISTFAHAKRPLSRSFCVLHMRLKLSYQKVYRTPTSALHFVAMSASKVLV